jgi:hypothetical protein
LSLGNSDPDASHENDGRFARETCVATEQVGRWHHVCFGAFLYALLACREQTSRSSNGEVVNSPFAGGNNGLQMDKTFDLSDRYLVPGGHDY